MARVKKVKFKVNLSDMFGERVPDNQDFKEGVAQAILDRIQERTESGMDKEGRSFTPYSDAYAKRKGVSAGDVDMTLFGDMLSDMDIVNMSSQTVTLGFPDETENAKAFNHTTGDTVPKRDFFGLPQKDLREIARRFSSELKELKSRERRGEPEDDETIESVIRGILSGQFDEDLGI